ncbi:glycosyltransferase family 71 protein [Piromyces sp. E2]|nr:glycosyltransferase family 71 protein [Piromyces sp. E2]|eukprot:OUM65259.1 glycosyltransferase family 71 protein [Piromyces sp. E2]
MKGALRKNSLFYITVLLFSSISFIQVIQYQKRYYNTIIENLKNNELNIIKTESQSNVLHDNENKNKIVELNKDKPKNECEEDEMDEVKNIIERMLKNSFEGYIAPDAFIKLRDRVELHTALWHSVIGKYDIKNKTGNETLNDYKEKLIKNTSFLSGKNIEHLPRNKKILSYLHQSLYHWMYGFKYKSFNDLITSSNGKGIVICTGDHHFKFARSTIDSLRHILNCTLPIQIFYNGDSDLSKYNQEILRKYKDITVDDISTYFDEPTLNIEGWAIKPFAILASRFEEVILMDADVVYLYNPEELFENVNYKKKEQFFFVIELSTLEKQTRHEMDSSTVVIYKIKTLLGLLATCKLNEGDIRTDVVYKMVHGDKETFWMGFDMARQHYYLNSRSCVVVGHVHPNSNKICGHIGQVVDNKLYYWNGHLVKDKDNKNDKSLVHYTGFHFVSYLTEWDDAFECLLYTDKKIFNFTKEEQKNFDNIIQREKIQRYIISEV